MSVVFPGWLELGVEDAVMASSSASSKRLSNAWEAEQSAAKKARGPRKRAVGALVTKAIDYNCKDLTPEEIDHIFIGGLSLRMRVARDKQLKEDRDPSAPCFGKTYWRDLRNMYMSPNRIQKQMVPKNDLPLDAALAAAVGSAMKGHANRSPLQSHMARCTRVNQRELVLLLRFLCELEPSASRDQLQTATAIMECLSRIKAHADYPVEMAIARPKFDQVATQAPREALENLCFAQRGLVRGWEERKLHTLRIEIETFTKICACVTVVVAIPLFLWK